MVKRLSERKREKPISIILIFQEMKALKMSSSFLRTKRNGRLQSYLYTSWNRTVRWRHGVIVKIKFAHQMSHWITIRRCTLPNLTVILSTPTQVRFLHRISRCYRLRSPPVHSKPEVCILPLNTDILSILPSQSFPLKIFLANSEKHIIHGFLDYQLWN